MTSEQFVNSKDTDGHSMEYHMNAGADKESEPSTRCDSCREHENGPCILHCRDLVPDTEFSRAICTLPSQLAFRVIQQPTTTDSSHSEGIIPKESRRVMASQYIPPRTVYGPLVADVVISTKKKRAPSRFGVNLGGNVIREYSLESDLTCNWMKYVRLSHVPTEVNLMAYQHGESVYFTVVKPLAAGDELCVGYSPAYADSIGKVGAEDPDAEPESLEDPSVPVLSTAATTQKTFGFAVALDSTSKSVSSAKRPGKKRKHPEEQSSPKKATIQLRAVRLRDLLPKPEESLAFTEAVQQVVKDAQQQLNQLNEVNRIRSVQINTIEHLGSDRFDNNNFESNIRPIRDVALPAHRREEGTRQASAQSGLVTVGSGTFLLPGALVHSMPLAERDSGRDMRAESPVASTDFFGGRDEENMEREESDADSDRTWSLPTVEKPEKKKKRTVKKKSLTRTRTLTIPQKLLRLKSSLPEADDEVSALPVSRKKKATKSTKKEMGDLRPEEHQKTDEIISGTVENDLLWNALLTQTPVPPPKNKNKKKKTKPKANAVEEQEVSQVVILDSEKDKPKKIPRVPKPRLPRARIDRRTKMPFEIDTLMANSTLPSASKLLVENLRYKFRCEEEGCPADFRLPGLLAIHATKHGAEMPVELKEPGPKSCPGCMIELADTATLVEHISEHERRYYRHKEDYIPCDECGKKLRSEKYLKIHKQRLHSGEVVKEFACKECPKTFLTLAGLRSHENFHMEKGYMCPVCLQMFSGALAMNVHGETHRVDGKFPCRICDKIYDSWLVMRRHMKDQHLKMKTHICTVCKKVCRKEANLRKHMLVHSDVYAFSCDQCGRKFKREVNLKGHKDRLHHPDRQYKMKDRSEKVARSFGNAMMCTICTRQYCSQERLEEHQRIKHGKNLLRIS